LLNKMKKSKLYSLTILTLMLISSCSNKIKHRFIAKDESRSQLHYIDQFDTLNNWTIDIGLKSRDIHLLENNRILVSCRNGFIEFDLETQKKVFEIHRKEFLKTETVLRLENGNTILGMNGKKNAIRLVEITKEGKLVNSIDFPNLKRLRLMRLSPEGHFLFGANNDRLIETDWSGHIYANIKIPDARFVYWIKKINNDKYKLTTGYGASFIEINAKGEILKKLGGKSEYYFFSRPFEMDNGNVVVSHWTGHGWDDSKKDVQLIEFDKNGNVMWEWHRPDISGSVHGVIVLD